MFMINLGAGGVLAACTQEDPKSLFLRSGFLGMVQDGGMSREHPSSPPAEGLLLWAASFPACSCRGLWGDLPKRHKILQEDAFSAKVLTQHHPCFLTRSDV